MATARGEGKTKRGARQGARRAAARDAVFCHCSIVHQDVIDRVKHGLADDRHLQTQAELFKVLADPTRLRIVNALILAEMCVCDIAALLGMTQPAVSHHLKVLRQTQLVKYRREGKVVYYSLDDEHVSNVFYQGLMHASE